MKKILIGLAALFICTVGTAYAEEMRTVTNKPTLLMIQGHGMHAMVAKHHTCKHTVLVGESRSEMRKDRAFEITSTPVLHNVGRGFWAKVVDGDSCKVVFKRQR